MMSEGKGEVPQHVKDAAARAGGEAPRAAPKGGEGANSTFEPANPEIEPMVIVEYRAAPAAPPDPTIRPAFGARPKLEGVTDGMHVRARTADPRSAGLYSGGVFIGARGTLVSVWEVRSRSEEHLKQLLTDPRIEVELATGGEA